MAANVETMFYTREKPWHGLGTKVEEAPTSADALRLAGLDWRVEQKNIQLCGGSKVPGYKANVRSTDGKVLGISIIKHAETPSLGAVAASKGSAGENFRNSFIGLSGTVAVSKDGGEADTISGATITSRAVAAGVNAALAVAAAMG